MKTKVKEKRESERKENSSESCRERERKENKKETNK